MADIKYTPSELLVQSAQMAALQSEFDALFKQTTNALNGMNESWSENIARNFSGKIQSAQKSFSGILNMLSNGSAAARLGATSHSPTAIESFLGSLDRFDKMLIGVPGQQAYSTLMSFQPDDGDTVSITGDFKKDVEQYYHNRMSSKDVPKDELYVYESRGSTTGKKHLIGDLYYEKTYDVKKEYGGYSEDPNAVNLTGGMSVTGTEIKLSEHSEAAVSIELNKWDSHLDTSFQPGKGNAYTSIGAEYDIASIKGTVGDAQNGLGSASVGFKAGLGAGLDVGMKNGVFHCRGGIAFGPGVDFGLKINYKNAWNTLCDSLKNPIF